MGLLERVLKPNHFKICASGSCEACLFQKVSLVTCDLLSWWRGGGSAGTPGRVRGSVLETKELGLRIIPYCSWMSGNPLSCLFSKCKNSNKSRSYDSLPEGQLELTRASVRSEPFYPVLPALRDEFVVDVKPLHGCHHVGSARCLSPGSGAPCPMWPVPWARWCLQPPLSLLHRPLLLLACFCCPLWVVEFAVLY